MNLFKNKELINNRPMHIATVSNSNKPNLAIVADVKVIAEDKIIIAHNEMINTPKNILDNKDVVLTAFDENWEGIRISGKAEYYTNGEYFDLVVKLFKNENTNPKGVIVVTVTSVDEIK